MFWKENNQKVSIHNNTYKSIEKKIRTNTIQDNWAHTKKNKQKKHKQNQDELRAPEW